jgi:hypothetical protein
MLGGRIADRPVTRRILAEDEHPRDGTTRRRHDADSCTSEFHWEKR